MNPDRMKLNLALNHSDAQLAVSALMAALRTGDRKLITNALRVVNKATKVFMNTPVPTEDDNAN